LEPKVPKTANKLIKITVDIQPGPALPAQKTAWKRFWQKLIDEVKVSDDHVGAEDDRHRSS
jgi:hypothetical protein